MYEARVIAVMENSFDVSLPEFGLERRIHLASLPISDHEYDSERRILKIDWKASRQTIQALDKVKVTLTTEMVRTPPSIRILAANPF